MPDILDELRTALDSAFERAEDADGDRRRRPQGAKPTRALKVLRPVAAAALVLAAVVVFAPTREGIPADERAVPGSPGPGPRIVHIDPRTGKIISAAPPFEHIPETGMSKYGPVSASVYERSPTTWSQQVQIDKGLDDGIHRGDPVVDGAGLVGTVAKAARGSSRVRLITDQSFATSVHVGRARHPGSITSASESPGDLLFEPVDATANVRAGDLVVTTGTIDPAHESRYPRAVPIGRVSRIELGNGDLDRRIYVEPAADLSRLGAVQVLTAPHSIASETP